ncbi:MAG: helix-turn-helix transcriptional regulator [Clostridia bacterium]|nr:helix-turn-helix transcriptional regulator [Clostridia bacterium]
MNPKQYEKIPIEDKNFPVRLVHLNGEGWLAAPHWHEHMEFLYFLNGSGYVNCGTSRTAVKKGTLVTVNSCELHSIFAREHLEYYVMILNPSMFKDVGCENILFRTKIENDGFVDEYFNEIFAEKKNKKNGYDMVIKGDVYKLLAHLMRSYETVRLSDRENTNYITKKQRLSEILKFIEENLAQNLTTAALAEKCYLSEYYFCRFFKKETGFSLTEYINKMRVEKAKVLLKNSNLSLSEIAVQTGFSDANYFCRIFKKYEGVTPNKMR